MFSRKSLEAMDDVADDALANCRTVALLNLRMWGFVFILEINVQHDWTRWCRRCNVPRKNNRNVFLPNIESEISTQTDLNAGKKKVSRNISSKRGILNT